MNRKGFIGSLFALVVAPKSIAAKMTEAAPMVETVEASKYIAGYVKVSKQMMRNLPFLQETLPRVLMRDLIRKESDDFTDLVKFKKVS